MTTAITPDVLAQLREEEHYVAAAKKGDRRVKLEKGQTWKLRFLPAKMGPRNTWYARIARHWLNMKPITCLVNTHPDFGGDPDAYCPVCEMAKVLNDSSDEAISQFGWKARAGAQWLTYCVVTDIDGDEVDGSDLLNPYEFWHYTNTWDELKGFYKGNHTKTNPLSILDYKKGNIFAVTKAAKGLRLDKLDQCPIFDDTDPNFNGYIQRLEAAIKSPKVVIPTQEQLEAFAVKMEEAAYKGDSSEKRTRRAPAVPDDPMEETDTEPAAEAAPVRRPSPAPAPAARTAPTPAARPAPAKPAAPALRPATPRPAPRPAPVEDLDGDSVPAEDDSNPDLMPLEEAPAPPPARTPARPALATASRKLAPMPAAEAPASVDEGAEEEQLPEETTDSAPAAEVEENAEELPPPPPPPVARRGVPGTMSEAIRSRVAAIKNREMK